MRSKQIKGGKVDTEERERGKFKKAADKAASVTFKPRWPPVSFVWKDAKKRQPRQSVS